MRTVVALAIWGFSATAMAGSNAFPCALSDEDYASLATLKWLRNGTQLTREGLLRLPEEAQKDVCETRQYLAEVRRSGGNLTLEYAANHYYIPSFLTDSERKLVSDAAYKAASGPDQPK